MSPRIIQAGTGQRPDLVICYLVGPHLDADLREALGPAPCVVAYGVGKPTESLDEVVADVRDRLRLEGFHRIVLAGYSLGCSGVRAHLLDSSKAGSAIKALVLIDGTHASKPAAAWQIDVWRKAFERARRGEILAVATHTQQTYVEDLRPPQSPFLATVTVLRQACDWPLDQAGPVDAPVSRHEGQLWVYSYASRSIDAKAHILQQRRALPMALRVHVRPWLEDGKEIQRGQQAEEPPLGADGMEQAASTPEGPRPGPPMPVHQLLRRGSRGPEVAIWQRIIGVEADGIFGAETEAITRRWQKEHKLMADGIVGPLTWSAATDEDPPPTARQVERIATPISEEELAAALELAHERVFQESPSRARLACAWAQVALENGRGQKTWNYNLGNITAFGQWPGQYYVLRVSERVQRNPDVWKKMDLRFRSHKDATDGAVDYWQLISGRFASVLSFFDAGDASGAAFELSRLRYYTAHADRYARTMAALYREFPG